MTSPVTHPDPSRPSALLQQIGSWLKTDINYLIKGGFWLSSGQVVSAISTFILAITFANILPKEVYGTYKYIISLGGILSMFSLSGISDATMQSVAQGHDGALPQAFKLNLLWSIPMLVASCIGAGYYIIHDQIGFAIGIILIGLLSPLFNSASFYGVFLHAKKEFKAATFYWTITTFSVTALMVLGIFFIPNPIILVGIYFGANCLTNLFFYWKTIHRYHPSKGPQDPGLVTYSKHLSLINIVGTLAGQLDSILVFHYVGAAELAIYSFATALPDQIKGMFGALARLAFPNFAQRSAKEIRATIFDKYLKLFIFGCVTVGVYMFAAPYIYTWFFPKYSSAIVYSQIFALSILNVALFPSSTYLAAKKKVREQYFSNFATYIFQIASLYIMMMLYGVLGLIVARVATRWFGSISDTYFFLKTSKKDAAQAE